MRHGQHIRRQEVQVILIRLEMVSTRVPWVGRLLGQLLLVVVMLGYVTTSGIQRYQMVSTNATAWEGDYQFLDEEHQEVMDHVDEAVNKIRAKIGEFL